MSRVPTDVMHGMERLGEPANGITQNVGELSARHDRQSSSTAAEKAGFGNPETYPQADNSGIQLLGVSDLPCLVDVLVGQTNIGSSCGFILPRRKDTWLPYLGYLTPLLRRVVLVREAA